MSSVFEILNAVNVNGHTEKKNGLTYLSWAWAWAEVKKRFPQATYKIYETESGCFYFTDGKTAWVKTGVTIDCLEHIEYLPVMDFKNKSIPVNAITSFDVNKAIQRSLTKAVARHGLGLYIYAGEDLPEDEKSEEEKADDQKREAVRKEVIGETRAKALAHELNRVGIKPETIFDLYKVKVLKDLTEAQHTNIIDNIDKILELQEKKSA